MLSHTIDERHLTNFTGCVYVVCDAISFEVTSADPGCRILDLASSALTAQSIYYYLVSYLFLLSDLSPDTDPSNLLGPPLRIPRTFAVGYSVSLALDKDSSRPLSRQY
jgi:hypothetical protein